MADVQQDPLKLTGETIDGKYLVEGVIGEGGFSVVYRAEHLIWHQPVALKCFKVQSAQTDEDMKRTLLEAFIQEGKLMTELSSRNSAIVQARDVGTITRQDGSWVPYMVLEWLDGKPLEDVLDEMSSHGEPARPLDSCLRMLNRAAEALALAHRRGIVHRDIKPSNLFVVEAAREGEESVKILDFGVAKVMAEHLELDKALQHTTATLTAFTPSYGAPEQFSRTHGATGPWTDVFAFALVMVEIMLGGQPALKGDDFLNLALSSTNEDERPTPRTLGLEVPDAVEATFAKALAVKPAERYPDMGAFWRDLWLAVFPEQSKWTPSDPPSSIPGISTTAPSPQSIDTSSRGSSRSPLSDSIGNMDTALAPGADADEGQDETTGSDSLNTVDPMHSSTPAVQPRSAPSSQRLLIGAAVVAVLAAAGWFGWRASSHVDPPVGPTAAAGSSSVRTVRSRASASTSTSASVNAAKHTCPKGMAYVPGGKFFMGSDDGPMDSWKPAHKVQVWPYCIDIHEVTAGEYKACSDVGECKRADTTSAWPRGKRESKADHERKQKAYSELCTFGKANMANHPINCVTWQNARIYCKAKGKRLPTEAEWEFAARGSDGRKFPWGDAPPDEKHMNACGSECQAWRKAHKLKPGPTMYEADDGFGGTAPVGSFPAGVTKYGLLDMVGNVFEWTSDWMGRYPKDEDLLRDPKGPAEGTRRVIRGGAFNGAYVTWVNPAFRYSFPPETHSHGVGFRCAASVR